jgi:hypothetical protein
MNDQELITSVRQSVHGVRMDVPEEQIVSRGRALRARGRRKLAVGVTACAAAGSVVLGLGLSGALGAAPDAGTGTIRTAAFTLTHNADGTDTLTLSMGQIGDPAVLQRALAKDGIRALVKVGATCTSSPAPPSPVSLGVLSVRLPDGTPVPGPGSSRSARSYPIPGDAVNVINPAKMPAGTELFFGYFDGDHTIGFRLIDIRSHTCSPGMAPVPPRS